MRIIAGEFGGRTLKAPDGMGTRPTMDRVREALFSILGDVVDRARVLDLYAGAGSLGLEALSRGALEAHFVEQSRSVAAILSDNLRRLEGARGSVHVGPVERMLPKLAARGLKFDVVFMDPPYRLGLIPVTLERLLRHHLLAPVCRVIAEHEARFNPPREVGHMFLADRRTYGDTGISMYSPLETQENR